MTVEEIDIIVNASVEKAVKEFEKLVPSIKKQLSAIKKEFNNTKFKEITSKVNTGQLKEQIKKAKKDIQDAFDPNDISGMKINGKSFKISNISGYSKEVLRLKGHLEEVKKTENEIGNIRSTNASKNVTEKRTVTGARTMNLENPNVNIWSILKEKISSIKPTMQAVQSIFKNTFNSKKPSAELELLNIKIAEIKSKLHNAKINLDYKSVVEAEVELNKLNLKKQKLEDSTKLSKEKNNMNSISGITIKIRNQIQQWGSGIKQGLGHVLKYAGALLSLRGIYSTLSSSANAWLSSQNTQAKQLSVNIEYMKYAMGSVFAPVIEYVTSLVYSLMKAVQSLVYAFSGVNIFAKATASSMKSASGSAKQTSKSLSSVHSEINNVSDNKNSNASGTPNIDLSEVDKTPNKIIDVIKNGNWNEIGTIIGEKLNDALAKTPWDKIQRTAKNIASGIAQTLNGFIERTDWNQVGNTFAQGINTVIYLGYNFVTTFDWKQFGKAIGNSVNGFFNNMDWTTAGKTFGEGIKGIFNSISSFVQEVDWAKIAQSIEKFIINIDWSGIAKSWYKLVGSITGAVWSMIIQVFKDIFGGIYNYFKKEVEDCGGNIVSGILKGIGDAIQGIGKWIYENIFQPFIDGFKNAFGIHSPSKVMEEQGNFIVEGLKNGLLGIWDKVKQPFIDLKNNITNKFTEIKNSVSNWANNTKETVTNWGNNVKTKVSECWTNASNTVREKVTTLRNNISTGLNNAKTTVVNWGSNVKNTFTNLGRNASTWGKDLATNMATGIKNNIHKVTNAVTSVANKIKSFLHFTEPDEGPLSNFHTYMPDMIDLMVSGIKSNTNKIKSEMENLAGTMSYTINTEAVTGIPSTNPTIKPVNIQSNNMMDTFEGILSNYERENNNNSGELKTLVIQFGSTKVALEMERLLQQARRQNGTAYAGI